MRDETVVIYGHSDDCVEVEGSVPGCDEYGAYLADDRHVVLLPSCDVIRIRYGVGDRPVWSIDHEVRSGLLHVDVMRAPDGDDPDPYTDRATVRGNIERVEVWKNWPPADSEIRDLLDQRLQDGIPREWSREKLARVLQAIDS